MSVFGKGEHRNCGGNKTVPESSKLVITLGGGGGEGRCDWGKQVTPAFSA